MATHGDRSKLILEGYRECVKADVITSSDRGLVLDFAQQFRVISPTIIAGYKEAKQGGYDKVYIAELRSVAENLTGGGEINEADRAKPYYKDLIKHVYPQNSGSWTSYERNESCEDRSSDLKDFKIEPRYTIDLLSQSEIRLKAGEALDTEILQRLQDPVYAVQRKLQEAGGDVERLKQDLADDVDKYVGPIAQHGALEGLDVSLLSVEQRLFLLLSESVYGQSGIDADAIKDMMVTYEFSHFEDVAGFIQGTTDRVSRSSNQDYALLCELSQFYSDRIKDVNKRLVESGFGNPKIADFMKSYFEVLSSDSQRTQKQEQINRLQVGKLGMTPGFVAQVGKILERRFGRKFTTEEVEKRISRYEGITGGLVDKSSTSQKPLTQAFYGVLRSQRERTLVALKAIGGEDVDPKSVHLGEVDLEEALSDEAQILEGKYDPEHFASYTAQRFIDIFETERGEIDFNLSKFESEAGKKREVVNGYIVKTHESANARMVGGVCVSGDNPDQGGNNMWDMPNYFQLVLQDPETLQSQGLVLMHHFTDQGKRVLSASINPSSTYLYSVDEAAVFRGIMATLEQFATQNGFDMITTSRNHTIRTNRTGGEFEKAIDERVRKVGKEFSFSENQVFSYRPNYQLKDMDVVWERPS